MANAGFYTLDSFYIKSMFSPGEYADGIELKRAVSTFAINESLESQYLSGSATVFESFDALKKVPLRGEEQLQISFTDTFGNSFSYLFYVYAITNLQRDNNTNGKIMRYTIHFTTFPKLESDKISVKQSFGEELVSNMANNIFERYFNSDKEIEIEPTTGNATYVIPNIKPDAAMVFLARRAQNVNSPSSLYYFFENREKYFFATYEYLVKKYEESVKTAEIAKANNLKYIFNGINDNSPEGQQVAQFSVADLSYNDRSNSLKAMKDGAYKRKTTELDYMTRQTITRVYDYLGRQEEHEFVDKLSKINTDEFVNAYMPDDEAPEVMFVTDYNQLGVNQGKNASLRPYTYYAENYQTKSIINYHLNNSSVTCMINGQGNLMAGMMIWLEVYDFAENESGLTEDRERSGKYLITSVMNIFSGDTYKQQLTLTKGGLREAN